MEIGSLPSFPEVNASESPWQGPSPFNQGFALDEPFGALDAKVRQGLRTWLRRLHDELHMTTILVTHDQEEALEVADRVVVMNQARIEQVATPAELFIILPRVCHGFPRQGKRVSRAS